MSFTGWTLDEARVALQEEGREVRVVETLPPFAGKFSTPVQPGVWRVLRCRIVDGAYELLVAREQVSPDFAFPVIEV